MVSDITVSTATKGAWVVNRQRLGQLLPRKLNRWRKFDSATSGRLVPPRGTARSSLSPALLGMTRFVMAGKVYNGWTIGTTIHGSHVSTCFGI